MNGALVPPPDTDLIGGNDLTGYVFVKVAGGSEPSSYTFPQSGGSASGLKYGGAITAWRGVDPTAPVVAVKWDSGTDPGPRNEIICPGVATVPGGVTICHFICDDSETWAVPADMTLINAQSPDSGVRLNGGTTFILPRSDTTYNDDTGMITWKASPATSPSASRSVTIISPSNTSDGPNMMGYTVSLRPAE